MCETRKFVMAILHGKQGLFCDKTICPLIIVTSRFQIVIIFIHRLNKQREEEAIRRLPSIPEFNPKWNAVVTYREMGERKEIDRRSWITTENQPLRYTLDALNIPQ